MSDVRSDYLTDGAEIYRRSFATIRAEADLARAVAEKTRALARMKFYTGSSNSFAPFFPLTTPIGGVVVEKNINPGQEVRPDQMLANAPQFFSPLFVITDPARLWVLLDVSEKDLSSIRPGKPVAVQTQATCVKTPLAAVTDERRTVADDPFPRMHSQRFAFVTSSA